MAKKKLWLSSRYAFLLSLSLCSSPLAQSQSMQSSMQSIAFKGGDGQALAVPAQTVSDYLAEVAPDGLYCWPANKLPVKVFFQVSDAVPYFHPSFVSVLKNCFDEWSTASDGKLGWIETTDEDGADIIVRWSAQPKERPEGTEGGCTKTYAQLNTTTNRGIIRKAEITLLTRLPNREFAEDEIRKAYLHEVGHAFGIAGHSPNRSDIMYFAVNKQHGPHLEDRDKATINHLYSDYELLKTVVGSGPSLAKQGS